MLKISFYALIIGSLCSAAFLTEKKPVPDCGLYGSVKDDNSQDPIPFANLALYVKDSLAGQATSGTDGSYCFKNMAAGTYDLKVTYIGYAPMILRHIVYSGKAAIRTNIRLQNRDTQKLDEVEENVRGARASQKRVSYKSSSPVGDERMAMGAVYYSTPVIEGDRDLNTENYSKLDDNDFKSSSRNPLSTFSIDVDKASYSNVRRFINQGQRPPADAVRVEELINYFSYSYPQPATNAPFSITTQYLACPWNSRHNLVHIGLQGREINTDKLPANNLVFLLDVSSSMEDPNKLPLLKSGLRLLIEQMRPQDKIAIVVYAGAAGIVLPSTPGNQKEKIIAALENLQAGGSTAGGEGILLAYKTARESFLKEGNNRVILATDGDFNVGASSDGELVRLIEKKREEGVFLTVLGFGSGNYKDSKMEQLADKGNGNYAYIDNILEAKKTLVKEMGGTLLTIARDVKIQVEFNPAKVKGYRLVGYENRMLNNEDFNDDKKDAGELGSGHTVTAIYEIIPAGSEEELTASVDSLKYQHSGPLLPLGSNEVMTIKFRYKEQKEAASRLLSAVVPDKRLELQSASESARFACAVASFGMLLRDSKYKGNSSYPGVLAMAKAAKGADEEGYRAEFIRLVEMAELLNK